MLLEEYFDCYISKKLEGYTDDFGSEEVPDEESGKRWRKSSENNMQVAKRLWIGLLGNRPFLEITNQEIREAKKLLMKLPETHSKSCSETRDLRRLIAETEAKEKRAIEKAIAHAKRIGGSEALIEKAELDNRISRIRVETIVKHVRALNRPAKMLIKLGELEISPFQKHMISARVEKAMRKSEETRDRRPWDDRLKKLLGSSVFQGECHDVGGPLFWSPLMALLAGGREEEILQLSPDDFECSEDVHYYRIQRRPGNHIKSDAAERVIPIHSELVRLGLLELVDLRRKQGEPRLFPNLERGLHKDTFTELFTKEFTRYRQVNKVYWLVLDFHALRTTFHHKLMDNLVPGYVKRRLMGHEVLDEGERLYAQKGISKKTLQGVINEIKFDISGVQSPFDHRKSEHTVPKLRIV